MVKFVVVALVVCFFFATVLEAVSIGAAHRMPKCPEDEFIQGWGHYSQGYWENYSCGPTRDDITGGK